MIYASAAAVVIALLAWDVARRWMYIARLASSAVMYRIEQLEDVERLRGKDVQNLYDRLNKTDDRLELIKKSVEALELRRQEHSVNLSNRIAALEVVVSAPVDLTKHDAAVKNLGVQLKELSDHVEEQFKRERASRAGMLAGPQGRRIVG